mmetsp:Transcript_39008/g.97636  ORF Transcript_39008/g.97636 Transcript_39008/m.97636 type:complete len:195 (-) Transcript_39008:227-811(-)
MIGKRRQMATCTCARPLHLGPALPFVCWYSVCCPKAYSLTDIDEVLDPEEEAERAVLREEEERQLRLASYPFKTAEELEAAMDEFEAKERLKEEEAAKALAAKAAKELAAKPERPKSRQKVTSVHPSVRTRTTRTTPSNAAGKTATTAGKTTTTAGKTTSSKAASKTTPTKTTPTKTRTTKKAPSEAKAQPVWH